MIFTITDKTKVNDFQKAFNDAFPFLKIDLFTPATSGNEVISSIKRIKDINITLGECGGTHPPASSILTISPAMTIIELKQKLYDLFKVQVLVFRKVGNSWLESTITESWTLEQQNKHGEILSKPKT